MKQIKYVHKSLKPKELKKTINFGIKNLFWVGLKNNYMCIFLSK